MAAAIQPYSGKISLTFHWIGPMTIENKTARFVECRFPKKKIGVSIPQKLEIVPTEYAQFPFVCTCGKQAKVLTSKIEVIRKMTIIVKTIEVVPTPKGHEELSVEYDAHLTILDELVTGHRYKFCIFWDHYGMDFEASIFRELPSLTTSSYLKIAEDRFKQFLAAKEKNALKSAQKALVKANSFCDLISPDSTLSTSYKTAILYLEIKILFVSALLIR